MAAATPLLDCPITLRTRRACTTWVCAATGRGLIQSNFPPTAPGALAELSTGVGRCQYRSESTLGVEGQCHQYLAPGRGLRRRLFCWDHKVGFVLASRGIVLVKTSGARPPVPHRITPCHSSSRQRHHTLARARNTLLRPPSSPPPFCRRWQNIDHHSIRAGETQCNARAVHDPRHAWRDAAVVTSVPVHARHFAAGCTERLPDETACATFAGHVQRRGALHDRRELLHAQNVGACSATDAASVLPARRPGGVEAPHRTAASRDQGPARAKAAAFRPPPRSAHPPRYPLALPPPRRTIDDRRIKLQSQPPPPSVHILANASSVRRGDDTHLPSAHAWFTLRVGFASRPPRH